MFIQFQGDLLDTPQIGNLPTERVKIQLDSLPFHLQIMYNKKGYFIELRYWENRFDRETLEVFLTCYEAVLLAMLNETSVRKLKRHMPESVYPSKYTIEAGKLNQAAGYTLVPDVDDDQKIRVYVLDDDLNKKPYGAWGQFYIMNYQPVDYVDVGPYPFLVPGVVYQTGVICLHSAGRFHRLYGKYRTYRTDRRCPRKKILRPEKSRKSTGSPQRDQPCILLHDL